MSEGGPICGGEGGLKGVGFFEFVEEIKCVLGDDLVKVS
jgi:hypothetical protein